MHQGEELVRQQGQPMGRRVGVIVAGAAIGLLAGVLAPVVFVAALVWDQRAEWSALTETRLALPALVLIALGCANGAIGAWDGLRSKQYRLGPVAWAPGLLFLFPAVVCALGPSDSKSWGPILLAVGIVAPFLWVAGRIGQEMGVRAGKDHRSPSTPDILHPQSSDTPNG